MIFFFFFLLFEMNCVNIWKVCITQWTSKCQMVNVESYKFSGKKSIPK